MLVALSLGTTALAQSAEQHLQAYDRLARDYLDMRYDMDTPGKIGFLFKLPGAFPKPPRSIAFTLDCKAKAFTLGAKATATDLADLKAIVANKTPIRVNGASVAVRDLKVGCDGAKVYAQSGSIWFTLAAMLGAGDEAGIGNELGAAELDDMGGLSFRIYDGYKFPNIREGFYYEDVLVTFDKTRIRADTSSGIPLDDTVTVVYKQGGKLTALYYDGKSYTTNYNPAKPITFYVQRGSMNTNPAWDALQLDYNAGRITWWQQTATPR